MSDEKTVVIVEDDFLIAAYIKQLCEKQGIRVVGVTHDAETAKHTIEATLPEYVLMDVRLGGRRDGVDIALDVHRKHPGIKVIFITGSNEPPTIDRIQDDHPYRILIKPILPHDLIEALS